MSITLYEDGGVEVNGHWFPSLEKARDWLDAKDNDRTLFSRSHRMSRNAARFEILEVSPERIVIQDVGPWDKWKTVTNAIEWTIEFLAATRGLKNGQRLLYYDSNGELTEAVHKDGKLVRFQMGVAL